MDPRNLYAGCPHLRQQSPGTAIALEVQHQGPQPAWQVGRNARPVAVIRGNGLLRNIAGSVAKRLQGIQIQQWLVRHQHKHPFHRRPQAADSSGQGGR